MSIPYGQNQGMWLGPDPAHQQQQQQQVAPAPAAPPMPAVPPPPASVQGPRLPPLLAGGYAPGVHGPAPGYADEPAVPVVGGGYPAVPSQQPYDQSALIAQQQQMIARLMQQNQQLMGPQQPQPPMTSGGWPAGVPAPVPASSMHSTQQQQMHPQQMAYQHQHAPQHQMPQAQPQPQQQQTVGHPPATAAQMLQEAWAILHAHQTAPAMQGVSGAALGRAVNTNIGGLAMGGPSAMHGEIYAAPQLTEQHQRLLVETQAPAIGQREAGVGGAPRLWFGETVGGQAPGLPTFGEGNDVRPFLYNPVQVPYGVTDIYVQQQQ